jgi:hypothetical protein
MTCMKSIRPEPDGDYRGREYSQNKILEIFISPFSIYTRDLDWRALGRRCINEICKNSYIVYRRRGIARANDWPTMVMSPRPSRKRVRTATWPESLGRSAIMFAIGLNASELAAAMPRHRLCVTLGLVGRLQNSLPIASLGARLPETFPKTAIYCHLLPF